MQEQVYVNSKLTKIAYINNTIVNKTLAIKKTNSLGSLLAKVWCWMTGGTWVEVNDNSSGGSNGEFFESGCDYSDTDNATTENPVVAPLLPTDGDFFIQTDSPDYTSTAGGGQYTYGGGVVWVQVYDSANASPDDGKDIEGETRPTDPTISWVPYVTSAAAELSYAMALTTTQTNWLNSNYDASRMFFRYLRRQGDAQEIKDQISWGIDYLMAHTGTLLNTFENQFLSVSEGSDGDYDSTYWDNANLTLPSQNLPTWSDFQAAFPFVTNPLYASPQLMYYAIGGEIKEFYKDANSNTCAIRMSRALNYSGITIPHIIGVTFKGADNKYYFLGAKNLNKWMRKTFGTNDGDPTTPHNANHYHITGSAAGLHGANLPSLLSGKQGIYSLVSNNFIWATGHADLLYPNGTCGNECHFYDAPIDYIDIWVLN